MPRALSEIYLEDATIDGVPYPSQGGHPISLTYLNGALSPFFPLLSGWAPAIETWAYASATTITVPSGATSRYQKGDKIRLKQGGEYKYFYIVSVSDTTLTITGGSDYTLANAAITDNYYSKAMNPQGWPVSLGQRVGDKEIWHAGNDGQGSGLDADLYQGRELKRLLFSGEWSTGDMLITDAFSYNVFQVSFGENTLTRVVAGRQGSHIRGVGGYSSGAIHVTLAVRLFHVGNNIFTLQDSSYMYHNANGNHGNAVSIPIADIWGIM
jgi:hypothetical protein